MKAWLANLLWDALWIFLWRLHDRVFDPQRAARVRFANRERWWKYHEKALATASKKDDLRARSWAVLFDFKTAPEAAARRGDLDLRARQMAVDSLAKTRNHP